MNVVAHACDMWSPYGGGICDANWLDNLPLSLTSGKRVEGWLRDQKHVNG